MRSGGPGLRGQEDLRALPEARLPQGRGDRRALGPSIDRNGLRRLSEEVDGA